MAIFYKFGPTQHRQHEKTLAYAGGRPTIPEAVEIPKCSLCRKEQTFFLQLPLEKSALWTGKSLAIFACTSCASESTLIPEMLPNRLQHAVIPEGFLESYQTNFRVVMFDTVSGVRRADYEEKLEFMPLETCTEGKEQIQVGGTPRWCLEDEAPDSYAGRRPLPFLFYLSANLHFLKKPSAPAQVELDLFGKPLLSPLDYYQLFIGNYVYGFGALSVTGSPLCYILTQV